MRNAWLGVALVGLGVAFGGVGCATSATPVQLRRVVLYQNGVGYFEREGRVENGRVALRLAPHEVDDVLTTLTVVERGDVAQQASPSAAIPEGRRTAHADARSRRGARARRAHRLRRADPGVACHLPRGARRGR
jgi:hypothetical protein